MTMSRRAWLSSICAVLSGCAARDQNPQRSSVRPARQIQTVTGPIAADRLGLTLMHEHVLVDFVGADRVSASRYNDEEVFKTVLPYLQQVRKLGCDTLVECTPAYLGRDPRLLRRLSAAAGLRILSNTGYYGAARDKHLPAHAFKETAEQLAERWIREATQGIDGTSIKPAFMKIGVDGSPLSKVDATLVRAAAITHRATGLPIASHTTSGAAAIEQLDILQQAGVPGSAFIWVHAHAERDGAFHVRAAQRGAWVEFDGLSDATLARHVELVNVMKEEGLLESVLISHDAGWYRVGEPAGGKFRPYDTLFTAFIPALRKAGFGAFDVRQLLIANPRAALTPRALTARDNISVKVVKRPPRHG